MRITEIARGIIKLLPYSFDVDLGKTDHPELEEKQRTLTFSLPTLVCVCVCVCVCACVRACACACLCMSVLFKNMSG